METQMETQMETMETMGTMETTGTMETMETLTIKSRVTHNIIDEGTNHDSPRLNSTVGSPRASALPDRNENRRTTWVDQLRVIPDIWRLGLATATRESEDNHRFPVLRNGPKPWSWMVRLSIVRIILPVVITGVFCVLALPTRTGGGGTVLIVGRGSTTLSLWRCDDKLIAQLINEIPPKSNISFYARTEPKANRCEALPK